VSQKEVLEELFGNCEAVKEAAAMMASENK